MDASVTNAASAKARPAGPPDTTRRIRRVFVDSLGLNLNEADLDYKRKLDEYAGLDSIAVLEFITALEKEFGITIEPELLRLELVRDLQELSAYVETRMTCLPGLPPGQPA